MSHRHAEVGDLIDGYCGGLWELGGIGGTKRIEAIGSDWVVVRSTDNDEPAVYAEPGWDPATKLARHLR